MKIREILLNLSIPIQKFMQKLHPPYAQTTVADAIAVMEILRDGDILLSREAWHFTNHFIPGFWSHAAIYGQGKVVEAVAPCVVEVDFRDWVIEKHHWVVIRPPGPVGSKAFKLARSWIGFLYDYGFKSKNKMLYCSELAYDAWADTWGSWGEHFKVPLKMGEPTITPQDFYRAGATGKFQIVKEHHDSKNGKII